MDIGESILFRHSKAGELCERFPFCIVSKRRDCWGVFNISGMANAFYKGTKVEELTGNVEGTPHYTMYPESIQDVVEVVGLARKGAENSCCWFRTLVYTPCANRRSFSFFR